MRRDTVTFALVPPGSFRMAASSHLPVRRSNTPASLFCACSASLPAGSLPHIKIRSAQDPEYAKRQAYRDARQEMDRICYSCRALEKSVVDEIKVHHPHMFPLIEKVVGNMLQAQRRLEEHGMQRVPVYVSRSLPV